MRGLKKLLAIADETTDIQTLLKIRQHLLYDALYDAERDLCIVAPASRCLDKIRNALAKAAGEEYSK